MVLIGSAEYLVEASGVQETAQSLQVFAENVQVSMEGATTATEAASKSAGASVIAYAALGAAIGVVFVDFIRSSSVMSTLTSAFGAVVGAIADTILIAFVPGLVGILNALVALRPKIEKLVERLQDNLGPAFDATAIAAGAVGDSFNDLDTDTQDLTVSIGFLAAGFALIALGRPVLGATLVLTAFALNLEGINETITSSGEQLAQLSHDFQTFLANAPSALAGDFAKIAGMFNDFFHDVQAAAGQFSIDILLALLPSIVSIQLAWGDLVKWFEDLWDAIGLAASLAWSGITTTFTGAWDGIVGFFQGFIDQLTGPLETFVNAFIDGINLLIAGLNAISLGVAAIPAIPHIELGGGGQPLILDPGLRGGEAAGGITRGPTTRLIGEAGQEALIPLDRLHDFLPPPEVTVHVELPSLDAGGEVIRSGAAIVHRGEQFLGGGGRASGGLTLNMTNYFSFAGGARGGADIRADLDRSMDRAAERFMTKVRRRD
ncbi:MAG: hypothetical protein V3U45_02315 [bacterium]